MTNPLYLNPVDPGRQPSCPDAEWALRCQLAECYRLIDHMGWTETIFNHISARLPGPAHHYLVNPMGLNYSEVTPGNLIKCDLKGNRIEDAPYEGNPAGFALHAVIHEHRPDVHCVLHTHTTAVSAIAQKEAGFDHNNFYGAQLYGRVGYHRFEGITLFAEEKARMLASIGDKAVLVLRNHGIAIAEASVPKAFFLTWIVQRAAEIQLAGASMPGPDTHVHTAVRQKCADLAAMLVAEKDVAEMTFYALVRKMHAEQGTPFFQ
ncbi:MAG: class II aldolase/adducin family protein [Zoogloeaceae bacterium]|jgi:ribulose-5-phosphate 4-epimerase/fuculose-1-phosphate aldolase|nr:class II aldolase/adducin family protein [Zoogloeaceae bacterium]